MRTRRILLIGLIAALPVTSTACTYDEQLAFISYLGCVVAPIFTGQPCTGPTPPPRACSPAREARGDGGFRQVDALGRGHGPKPRLYAPHACGRGRRTTRARILNTAGGSESLIDCRVAG